MTFARLHQSSDPAIVRDNPLAADLDHILRQTEGLWEPLRGQNIFVTGGTGFFGRWLLESFVHVNDSLGLGASIVVLSRNPESFVAKAPHLGKHPAISFVRGDVRSFTAANVRSRLGSKGPTQFSFVIHAATESSGNVSYRESAAPDRHDHARNTRSLGFRGRNRRETLPLHQLRRSLWSPAQRNDARSGNLPGRPRSS